MRREAERNTRVNLGLAASKLAGAFGRPVYQDARDLRGGDDDIPGDCRRSQAIG